MNLSFKNMAKSKGLSNEITAYALRNAIEYGKAEAGRILPKLFQHGLAKDKIKEVMPEILEVVKEINAMNSGERIKKFENYKKYVVEHEEKEKELPEIDVSDLKKVVTRIPPEPSKYNHLGHAITFLLSYLYAKKYKGKCLLRFEDANPEKVAEEYVDAMKEDVLKYLEIKVDAIRFVSDDIKKFYSYGEKMIKQGDAFICFCNREKMQDLRHKGIECECRQFPIKIHMKRWKAFLKGEFKEGEATMRLKSNMQNLNQVMRDPVLFRRIDAKHYRQGNKYKIWPMYDFYNPIEEHLMGVTLILRSNEFDTRIELQDHIKDLLKLNKQKIIQYGRFNVEGFTTKGREIRELIESGEYIGWDDPRLITLRALKRRGITKEAIYELTNQVGLSKHPVNLTFDMIASINRKIIDKTANRYSFAYEPIKLEIKNKPVLEKISVPIHPDKKEMRKINVKEIFISKNDAESLKGKEIRLIHLYNIKLEDEKGKSSFTSVENKDIQKIQWVSNGVKCKVLMPDGKWIEGIGEKALENLKKDEMVQFERFGFVKFDRKEKDSYEFWFAHK